jgi:hypothetical protein
VLFSWCQWLENTSWATAIREGLWQFPLLETIHLLSMILLVAATAALDLRLAGFALRRQPVSQLAGRLLPTALAAFGINLVTGFFLFASEATSLYVNRFFFIKLVLIVVAVLFHFVVYRKAARWDDVAAMPAGAKLTGCFSLILWIGVVAAARWIAYV